MLKCIPFWMSNKELVESGLNSKRGFLFLFLFMAILFFMLLFVTPSERSTSFFLVQSIFTGASLYFSWNVYRVFKVL